MKLFYEKNRLAITIALCILIASLVWFVGGKLFESSQEQLYNVERSVVIDNAKQLDYELKTNSGLKVALQGNGDTKELLGFDFMTPSDKYINISFDKQKYTMHTRTVKSGDTYRTETYYSWDDCDSETISASNLVILGKTISINNTELMSIKSINPKEFTFKSGETTDSYWFPKRRGNFTGNIRYSFDGMSNKQNYTFAGELENGKLVGSDGFQKLLIIGQKDTLISKLENNKLFTIVSTILGMIVVCCLVVYISYKNR